MKIGLGGNANALRRRLASALDASANVALKILVVDDNLDGAQSLAELLSVLGHEVRVAHDGQAALVVATEFRPQVILLDIGLPICDGYEVCRRIRAQPSGGEVFVVATTGWGDEDALRKGAFAGFDRHLVKPVDESVLASTLASATKLS